MMNYYNEFDNSAPEKQDFLNPNNKEKHKKEFTVFLSVIIVLSLLMGVLSSSVIRSYITGVPVHFRLIDANSYRSDVVKMYGKKIAETPKGVEIYKAKFLGIEGDVYVEYYEDSDQVYLVQFVLRSGNYANYEDFEKDVEKTYKYFSTVLRKMPKSEPLYEGDRGDWADLDTHRAYCVYDVNTVRDETGSHFLTDEIATAFQFNTWTEEMENDFVFPFLP